MTKILKKECPFCNKLIESIHEEQLEYNYLQHYEACLRRKKKKEEEEKDV